jgi:hypothetical protein
MTTPTPGTRRIRATIIGFGLDEDRGSPKRIITGDQCLLVGGSEETHAELLETMLRLESELERLGQSLGDLPPDELAEVAWRIDSPELQEIARRLEIGLERRGARFHDATAEDLTAIAAGTE